MKQRLRYKLADTGVWPIDVSLYGELVENEREFELEAKVILQRRLGIARIMANVTAILADAFRPSRLSIACPPITIAPSNSASR